MATFFVEILSTFRTAILTMGNDILTMTMVKHYSLDGNVTDILVNNGGKVSQ